jgi:hypothetical protein
MRTLPRCCCCCWSIFTIPTGSQLPALHAALHRTLLLLLLPLAWLPVLLLLPHTIDLLLIHHRPGTKATCTVRRVALPCCCCVGLHVGAHHLAHIGSPRLLLLLLMVSPGRILLLLLLGGRCPRGWPRPCWGSGAGHLLLLLLIQPRLLLLLSSWRLTWQKAPGVLLWHKTPCHVIIVVTVTSWRPWDSHRASTCGIVASWSLLLQMRHSEASG